MATRQNSVTAQLAEAGQTLDPDGSAGTDTRIEKLVLDVVRHGSGLDTRIDGATEDGSIEQTTQMASALHLRILDRDLAFLNSEHLGYRMDLTIDRVPFRLVQVSLAEDYHIDLTFEHRIVAWLRQHDSPLKVSRSKMTRAEFAYKMVREVQAGPVHFVSPSVHVKQPIKAPDKQTAQQKRDRQRQSGFAPGVKFRIKGVDADAGQVAELARALGVAADLNAGPKATLALVVAGIGESAFRPVVNSIGYGGVFQGDVSHRYHYFDKNDTEGEATSFLQGGKGFGAGGAIALAKAHPDYSPGTIATLVEVSGQPGSFYDRYRKEAEAIIAAYQGGGDTFGGGGAYYSQYEFTRGQPGPNGIWQKEDSWDCMTRLAREVRWRCFVAGANSVFFCSDDDLMKSRSRYKIDPQTSGVQWVTFDVEVGGRTVLVRGVRQPRPSTAQLLARVDRWAAPPGTVIELDGYGPANGRWLVDSITRPLFDPLATVQLRQPQKALPEPRAQVVQRNQGAGNGTAHGKVKIDPGANRPGVSLKQPILDFLALVAAQWGHTIEVMTGTNHNRLTVDGNVSDHWDGNAADISIGPGAPSALVDRKAAAQGDAIATAALVVLGVDQNKAHSLAISGALNFGPDSDYTWRGHRVQVGWRTYVGGNHYTHVHIGVA